MKKIRVISCFIILTMCLAVFGVGIFAISPTKNNFVGSITINSANPEVIISAYFQKQDGSLDEENPIIENKSARHGIDIELGNITFDTTYANDSNDLLDLDVIVVLRLQNPGENPLGVYFSEKEMSANASENDVITKKALTTTLGVSDVCRAILCDYSKLNTKTNEGNGVLELTVRFRMLKYLTNQSATVSLKENINKIYLNIETLNEELLPVAVGAGDVGNVESLKNEKKIVLNYGVEGIDTELFKDFTTLESIVLPESVTYISEGAFSGCSNLKNIVIPNSVQVIHKNAFAGCTSLEFNSDPSDLNLNYIGNDENPYVSLVSVKDTTVDSIKINNRCYIICGESLKDCSNLTELNVPNSVTFFGVDVFAGCTSLNKVNIFDLEHWCTGINFYSINSNPLRFAGKLYLNDKLITHLEIPNTITTINARAFAGCTSILTVNIPDSIKSIGNGAFYTCNQLTEVTIPSSVESMGYSVFYACNAMETLTIKKGTPTVFECQIANNGFYLNGEPVDYLQNLERFEDEDTVYTRQ